MKKIFCLALISSFAFAQETAPEKAEGQSKLKKEEVKIIPMPTSSQQTAQRSIMIVQPKEKAADFIQAFELLKKEKPSSRIFFKLYSGKTINNILEVSMLDNGTLILFKVPTSQGTKSHVVSTEDIEEISHI